jgi:TadE-like protein/PKD domain
MMLPWRRNKPANRGQALVEFALVLPLLLLMLLMALDFGRVFFGWVALQNASRIGADYAAGHADAWNGSDPLKQADRDRYQELVLADLKAINCNLDTPDPVADPIFPTGFDDGDLVRVNLDCSFGLLTPLAENLFGGPVSMRASTEFSIYRTISASLPSPGPTVTPPGCAAPSASFGTSTSPANGKSPVTALFTNTSTAPAACPIASYFWDFGNGMTSTAQNPTPPGQVYTNPGPANNKTYTITLTVTSSSGTDVATATITVKK